MTDVRSRPSVSRPRPLPSTGSKRIISEKAPSYSMYQTFSREFQPVKIEHEFVSSSLPLQMALYFNVVFFPCWLLSTLAMLHVKFDCLATMYQFIITAILIAVISIECLRLYLGYLGNLMEKLPELAGFWMLSLLLQLPLQFYLLISKNTALLPLDYTVQSIMIILLTVQIVSGFSALRTTAKQQTHRFRLMQFYSMEESTRQDQVRPKVE